MHFLSAIHGIHTKITRCSWPYRLQAYTVREQLEVVMQPHFYWANWFAPYNNWVLNKKHGKSVAVHIEILKTENPGVPISMVAHSNGGPIAINAAKRLIKLGYDVDTIILIGAAIHSDVVKNGLLPLQRRGHIKRLVCYASLDDKVIKPLQWWPGFYGSLGARGWQRDGSRAGLLLTPDESAQDFDGFLTRWFPGYSHGQYFEEDEAVGTFELIARDLGLEKLPNQCVLNDPV